VISARCLRNFPHDVHLQQNKKGSQKFNNLMEHLLFRSGGSLTLNLIKEFSGCEKFYSSSKPTILLKDHQLLPVYFILKMRYTIYRKPYYNKRPSMLQHGTVWRE